MHLAVSASLIFNLLAVIVHAELTPLPRDGVVTDQQFIGYSDINYHAIRFEPLCGSLGSTQPIEMFQAPFSVGGQCDEALSQFSNISDPIAFFDLTGVKLSGDASIVGSGGDAMCMCMSLVMLSGGNSNLCVWVDGNGEAQTQFYLPAPGLGYILQSSFKPGSGKALPQCGGGVNVTSLETKWSATAFFSPNSTVISSSTTSTASTVTTSSSTVTTSSSSATSSSGVSSTNSGQQVQQTNSPSSSPPNGASATKGSSDKFVLVVATMILMVGLQVI